MIRQRAMRSKIANIWHALGNEPRATLCGYQPVSTICYADNVRITCKVCIRKLGVIELRRFKAEKRLIPAKRCEHSLDEICYPCRFDRLPREPEGAMDVSMKTKILRAKMETRSQRETSVSNIVYADHLVYREYNRYDMRCGGGTRRVI